MLGLLLRLLEKAGRKKVLVNFMGEVVAYRWYVLYLEEDEDTRFIARFPNIYIHQNLMPDTPDGPEPHKHAWNTYSLMLNGGYWEEVNGRERYNPPGSWALLKYGDYHRITKTNPNAWSMFCHGFRKGRWGFKQKACETICATCAEKYGVCVNTTRDVPYEAHFGGKALKRRVHWFPSKEPGLEKRLARRREAVKKITLPTLDEVNARITAEIGERDA